MIKKLALAILAISVSAPMLKAEVNFDGKAFSLTDEITKLELSVPAPVTVADKAARPDKEWTVMVFINGKNNLEKYAFLNINQMEKIGSSDKVNVVVQFGRMNTYSHLDGTWKGTRRYLIKKGSNPKGIFSPVVSDIGKVDMGSFKSVIDFSNWAKQTYPAKHYMLIIWNHGAGWIKGAGADNFVTKGISYDDETNNHITTPQMGTILKTIGGVDVYGSDACLMQMAEVDYEIKDYANFIVGSEETEAGDGYTYDTLLGPLVSNPAMTPEGLATVAVDAYTAHYTPSNEAATQSYVRSAALPGFLAASNAFASSLMNANEKPLVKTAMGAAQAYAYAENKDLYHFTQLVVNATANSDVKAKGNALMNYISNTLVGDNKISGNYSNSHGIAVYLPGSAAPSAYADLVWAKVSNWDDLIAWLAN
jgi:hypothetical protein